MAKIRYYPTFEQAIEILDENLLVNFMYDSLYSVPFVYPCDTQTHFTLEMMNVLCFTDVNETIINNFMDSIKSWDNNIKVFKQHFKSIKGRDFNE